MLALTVLPFLFLPMATAVEVMSLYFTFDNSNKLNLRPQSVPTRTVSETMCLLLCKLERNRCQTIHFNAETSMCSRWGGQLNERDVPNANLYRKTDLPLVCEYDRGRTLSHLLIFAHEK